MTMNKDSLMKLTDFIEEIVNLDGYDWFRNEIVTKLKLNSGPGSPAAIDEIYEYCIRLIIKEHAERFYEDFKLIDIKEKLLEDFERMEKFRREDKFEDFCLALFQQIEGIVNYLCLRNEFYEYLHLNKDTSPILQYDRNTKTFFRGGNQTIGKLIFKTKNLKGEVENYLQKMPNEWSFLNRLRAVIFYYYFNKELKINEDNFNKIYELGNFLYQGRNLNHRGNIPFDNQIVIIENLRKNQHKFYFRFLGFLENFVTTINLNV